MYIPLQYEANINTNNELKCVFIYKNNLFIYKNKTKNTKIQNKEEKVKKKIKKNKTKKSNTVLY